MNFPHLKPWLHFALTSTLWCMLACNNQAENIEPVPPDSTDNSEPIAGGLDKLNYMRLHDGKFRTNPGQGVPITNREDLKATFDSLRKKDSSIVIYFHGGFIPIQKAYTEPLTDGFDHAFRNGKHFPYYMLYGNGAGNTIWVYLQNRFFNNEDEGDAEFVVTEPKTFEDSIQLLSKKKSFIYLVGQFNRKYSGNDAFKSREYAPYKDTVNLEEIVLGELNRQPLAKSLDMKFVKDSSLDTEFEQQLYNDKTLQELARQDLIQDQGFAADSFAKVNPIRALYNIIKTSKAVRHRFNNHREHDVSMTIVEEILYNANYLLIKGIKGIAQGGWTTSKSIVSNAFLKGDNYGGTALLQELTAINQQAVRAGTSKHIWLVGSSTGTIMICELLKSCKKPEFSNLRFNIIFSVASCSMKLFGQALDSAEDKIDSFYLFGLSEDNERLKPKRSIWAGSILYFVSSVCEADSNSYHDKPLVGMQRFYKNAFRAKATFLDKPDEKKQIERVIKFLDMKNGYSPKVIWSNDRGPTQDPDLNNDARRHGGVIRDSAVQASITNLLNKSN